MPSVLSALLASYLQVFPSTIRRLPAVGAVTPPVASSQSTVHLFRPPQMPRKLLWGPFITLAPEPQGASTKLHRGQIIALPLSKIWRGKKKSMLFGFFFRTTEDCKLKMWCWSPKFAAIFTKGLEHFALGWKRTVAWPFAWHFAHQQGRSATTDLRIGSIRSSSWWHQSIKRLRRVSATPTPEC